MPAVGPLACRPTLSGSRYREHGDGRLPTMSELQDIMHFEAADREIDTTCFQNTERLLALTPNVSWVYWLPACGGGDGRKS
ncbi:MAG: hypothetical protein ACMG6H_00510 [Acidobacteriota bacterium]